MTVRAMPHASQLHIVMPAVGPSPTADAYKAACEALQKHRLRADTAEAAVQRVRDLCAAVGPGAVYTTDILNALTEPESTR